MKYQNLFSWEKKKETICMKCQNLFSRKNKKNISECCLLKFLPSMQSINHIMNKKTLYVKTEGQLNLHICAV